MRKDAVHTTWLAIAIAIVPILVMTLGKTALSWSQNHFTSTDYLLYPALSGIMAVFLIRSFTHPKKDERLFWIVNNRNWNRLTAFLFSCVLWFGVNSPIEWVGTAHIIATGLAIVSAYVGMSLYYHEDSLAFQGALTGACAGGGLFLFAYLTPFMTIAEGEMFAAVPIIIWVLSTTKIK